MVLAALALAGCGGTRTESRSGLEPPGAVPTARTRALDAGAALLQDREPLEAMNAYLDGFHFRSADLAHQVEAHHYCANVNEELIQCAIFDGNGREAKLVGVEYIVSERLFAGLPEREKALWHSHAHEVKSGQLVAPGIPDAAEHALMRRIVRTYGKTWHTWQHGGADDLPLGVPQLMMGFTADGQIDPGLVAARDRRFGLDTAARRAARADIPAPAVLPGADAWLQGRALQLADPRAPSRPAPQAGTRPPDGGR